MLRKTKGQKVVKIKDYGKNEQVVWLVMHRINNPIIRRSGVEIICGANLHTTSKTSYLFIFFLYNSFDEFLA